MQLNIAWDLRCLISRVLSLLIIVHSTSVFSYERLSILHLPKYLWVFFEICFYTRYVTVINLQYSTEFSETKFDVVHLTDENAGHREEKRGTIHIDIAADRQHESCNARIHSKFTFHAAECHRQSCCTGIRITYILDYSIVV